MKIPLEILTYVVEPVQDWKIKNPVQGSKYFNIVVHTGVGPFKNCYEVPESFNGNIDSFLLEKVKADPLFQQGPPKDYPEQNSR